LLNTKVYWFTYANSFLDKFSLYALLDESGIEDRKDCKNYLKILANQKVVEKKLPLLTEERLIKLGIPMIDAAAISEAAQNWKKKGKFFRHLV